MQQVLLQVVVGLSNAMLLFLIAAGLSLIFGVTRIINFAHGSFYMLAAYTAYTLSLALPESPWRFWVALLVAPTALAAVGVLVEMTVLRRIYHADELYQLLLTFGLVLIASDAVRAIWGVEGKSLPRPEYLTQSVNLLGVGVPAYYLLVIVLGPLVGLALAGLVHRTRWGVLVRAARDDREMTSALGIHQARLFSSVFALGTWLAGLGGALSGLVSAISPVMDASIIVEAFAVVVIGGMGSFLGSFLASLIIGELKALAFLAIPRVSFILVFALMAVILMVRPWGLLGTPEE